MRPQIHSTVSDQLPSQLEKILSIDAPGCHATHRLYLSNQGWNHPIPSGTNIPPEESFGALYERSLTGWEKRFLYTPQRSTKIRMLRLLLNLGHKSDYIGLCLAVDWFIYMKLAELFHGTLRKQRQLHLFHHTSQLQSQKACLEASRRQLTTPLIWVQQLSCPLCTLEIPGPVIDRKHERTSSRTKDG